MSTLVDIETAAKKLSANDRQRLLISLAESLRLSGQTLPEPRVFSTAEMEGWMDEDEKDLRQLRGQG